MNDPRIEGVNRHTTEFEMPTEVEAIRAHHAGDHLIQPCAVDFDDDKRSACDIQTLLAVIDGLTGFVAVLQDSDE